MQGGPGHTFSQLMTCWRWRSGFGDRKENPSHQSYRQTTVDGLRNIVVAEDRNLPRWEGAEEEDGEAEFDRNERGYDDLRHFNLRVLLRLVSLGRKLRRAWVRQSVSGSLQSSGRK